MKTFKLKMVMVLLCGFLCSPALLADNVTSANSPNFSLEKEFNLLVTASKNLKNILYTIFVSNRALTSADINQEKIALKTH